MKKRLILFAIIVFAVTAAQAANKEVSLTAVQEVRFHQLEARVQTIKSMDKSQLSFEERRALRKELVGIKREMKGFTSGGVYLSAAAIIIIILVLILIL